MAKTKVNAKAKGKATSTAAAPTRVPFWGYTICLTGGTDTLVDQP